MLCSKVRISPYKIITIIKRTTEMKNTTKIKGEPRLISIIKNEIDVSGIEQFVLNHQKTQRSEMVNGEYTSTTWYRPGAGILSHKLISPNEIEIQFSTFYETLSPALGIASGISRIDPSLEIEHIFMCRATYLYGGFNLIAGEIDSSFMIISKDESCEKIVEYLSHLPETEIGQDEFVVAKQIPGRFELMERNVISGLKFDYIDEYYTVNFSGDKLFLLISYDACNDGNASAPYISRNGKTYEMVNMHWSNEKDGLYGTLSEQCVYPGIDDLISIVPASFLYSKK